MSRVIPRLKIPEERAGAIICSQDIRRKVNIAAETSDTWCGLTYMSLFWESQHWSQNRACMWKLTSLYDNEAPSFLLE